MRYPRNCINGKIFSILLLSFFCSGLTSANTNANLIQKNSGALFFPDLSKQTSSLEQQFNIEANISYDKELHYYRPLQRSICGTTLKEKIYSLSPLDLQRKFRKQKYIVFNSPVIRKEWTPINGDPVSNTIWQASVYQSDDKKLKSLYNLNIGGYPWGFNQGFLFLSSENNQ